MPLHKRLINQAVINHNNEHLDDQITIIHLNLPSKTYLGYNTQNTTNNINSFNAIVTSIEASAKHEELLGGDAVYRSLFNFMNLHRRNSAYFCGERGHQMAFAMKVLLNKHNSIPSGGCKSAKDRDGAQKLFDEIYFTLLYLTKNNFPDGATDFFETITPTYISSLQDIVKQNGIAEITALNTNYPGNKNFDAIKPVLGRLGFKDLSIFKGQSSEAAG